jgi:hypothetical protein
MSLRPRLRRLEQQTGASAGHEAVCQAIARLRVIELPEGDDRPAVAHQILMQALDGLGLSERMREWDPDLRAALSDVFSQLTTVELRAMTRGLGEHDTPSETAT